MRISLRFIEIR